MVFGESTNWHEAVTLGEELGKAERQLDAAISGMVGGGSSASGLQVIYVSTSTGVVQASTSEGSIIGSTGIGSVDLPIDFFAEGVVLRVTARGYYSSLDGTDNLNLRIKLEGTLLIATGNFTPPTAANRYWEISALVTCRSAGATGTVFPNGRLSYDDGAGEGMVVTSAVTIDTTASLTFELTAQWDTSDADNSVSCTNLVLEKLQVGNASLSPDDVVVEFETDASDATTDAETHDVNVVLTLPEGSQIASAVTVNWSSTNVEAPTSGTVTFPAGSSNGATQAITLDLDYSAGNPVVTLSSPSSNATLGAEDTHTVTISSAFCRDWDFTSSANGWSAVVDNSVALASYSAPYWDHVYNDIGGIASLSSRCYIEYTLPVDCEITQVAVTYEGAGATSFPNASIFLAKNTRGNVYTANSAYSNGVNTKTFTEDESFSMGDTLIVAIFRSDNNVANKIRRVVVQGRAIGSAAPSWSDGEECA